MNKTKDRVTKYGPETEGQKCDDKANVKQEPRTESKVVSYDWRIEWKIGWKFGCPVSSVRSEWTYDKDLGVGDHRVCVL